ncbi:MAG: hypothetical protein LBM27_01330 [Lactobacillaceae bacterium]|jgi:hypothetical protein|nr:hypothetical protein [Lactobacillaceae bacterium]
MEDAISLEQLNNYQDQLLFVVGLIELFKNKKINGNQLGAPIWPRSWEDFDMYSFDNQVDAYKGILIAQEISDEIDICPEDDLIKWATTAQNLIVADIKFEQSTSQIYSYRSFPKDLMWKVVEIGYLVAGRFFSGMQLANRQTQYFLSLYTQQTERYKNIEMKFRNEDYAYIAAIGAIHHWESINDIMTDENLKAVLEKIYSEFQKQGYTNRQAEYVFEKAIEYYFEQETKGNTSSSYYDIRGLKFQFMSFIKGEFNELNGDYYYFAEYLQSGAKEIRRFLSRLDSESRSYFPTNDQKELARLISAFPKLNNQLKPEDFLY